MAFSDLFPPLKISIDRIGLITEADGSSHTGFACAITSPAPAANLTTGVPVTISGTFFGAVVVIQVKLGSTVLGSASIVGNTWSYTYTPQSGDVGARTINAVATHTSGAQVSAPGVDVTVVSAFTGNFGALFSGVVHYLRSDLGVTQTSGNVTAWATQVGSGDVTPGSGASLIGTVGTGSDILNGKAGITANGVDQNGQYTIPLAIPVFIWAVWKLKADPGGLAYVTTFDGNEMAITVNAGRLLTAQNGTSTTNDFAVPLNTPGITAASMNNSASDYVTFGAGSRTGTATGTSARTGARGLFARPTSFGRLNATLWAMVTCNQLQSPSVVANAAAQANAWFNTTLN